MQFIDFFDDGAEQLLDARKAAHAATAFVSDLEHQTLGVIHQCRSGLTFRVETGVGNLSADID